ncbi:MAG: hypothetical protein HYS27_02675 [Deltaproteobacteria bacterium]|nr:hypothetical protein [Deltaproteobacteria bacterium]
MRRRRHVLLGLVLPLGLAAACELPTPPFGRVCDAENPCPDGYLCDEQACIPRELVADAGPLDAGP